MKKIFTTFVLCLSMLLSVTNTYSQTVDDVNEKILNGVWWTSSPRDVVDLKNQYPYLKGSFKMARWDEIEKTPGVYDWSKLDQLIISASEAGIKFGLIIHVGPAAPQWLYKAPYNVPCFENTDNVKYPDYLNSSVYVSRWHTMLDAAFKHIKNDLSQYNSCFVIYNAGEGSTGDEDPFKGTRKSGLTWPYSNISSEWINFRWESWKFMNDELVKYFYDESKPSKSSVSFIVNPGNGSSVVSQNMAYLQNPENGLQYAWVKVGHAGHGYQINDEVSRKLQYDPVINDIPMTCRTQSRSRSEMDETDHPYFASAPKWNYYWLALGSMWFGLDTWVVSYDQMADPNYVDGLNIYSKYAGIKTAACTDKAYCALRDGLNAADTTRFPNSIYGTGNVNSYDTRALAIAATFATFGAKQEDPFAANGGGLNQRNANKMNDVGWNIYDGNYESFVTQINKPTGLYRGGYWRQGALGLDGKPADSYGRFVKAFDPVHKINDYYFDINDKLNLNTSDGGETYNAHIRVTYYNTHHGLSWQFIYTVKENGKAVQKTYTVKTDYKVLLAPTWQVLDLDINNLYISNKIVVANGSPADIQFHNNSKSPQGFHMIEISNQGVDQDAVDHKQAASNLSKSSVLTSVETINVFPNPSSGLFNVSWKLNAAVPVSIEVMNTAGAVVYTKKNHTGNNIQINLTDKTSGVYFIKISQGDKTIKSTLVKQQ